MRRRDSRFSVLAMKVKRYTNKSVSRIRGLEYNALHGIWNLGDGDLWWWPCLMSWHMYTNPAPDCIHHSWMLTVSACCLICQPFNQWDFNSHQLWRQVILPSNDSQEQLFVLFVAMLHMGGSFPLYSNQNYHIFCIWQVWLVEQTICYVCNFED